MPYSNGRPHRAAFDGVCELADPLHENSVASSLHAKSAQEAATIIVEVDILTDFKKHLERLLSFSATSVILNEVGVGCGLHYCSRTESETRLGGEELLRHIAKKKLWKRWGEFDFTHVDLAKKRGYVVVRGSFEARKYGSSRVPACHFLRGFLRGLLRHVLGERVVLGERKCLARGDPCCEFHLRLINRQLRNR